MQIIPVILSGGSGSRLWPLSREQHPKQYLPLVGNNTMLQETLLRLKGLDNLADPVIICNSSHRFMVAEQLKQMDINNPTVLLEPVGKNTAPAIAAAAIYTINSAQDKEDQILLILSADHLIEDISSFYSAIDSATKHATNGKLVTFGIVPVDANTGYGYIHKGEALNDAFTIKEFVEKPNQKDAKSFLNSGDYLWNSGMFMFKPGVFIGELFLFDSGMASLVDLSIKNASSDLDFFRLDSDSFSQINAESIDYAVMEKTDKAVVVPLNANWHDIGSWSALYDISKKDENNNVIKGDVVAEQTSNSYIYASNKMIATLGIDNLVIIDTPDATLIASKDKSQELKVVIKRLIQENRYEQKLHRKVYRPWGWYDSLESGSNFQVKRLHINPGAKLSLQAHQKRAEHWVVIKGKALVTCNDKDFILKENQSTYIPKNSKHRIENCKDSALEIVEVQSGEYFGEDDIIRFDDKYGRN